MSHQTSKKPFRIQLGGEQTKLRLLDFVCWPALASMLLMELADQPNAPSAPDFTK